MRRIALALGLAAAMFGAGYMNGGGWWINNVLGFSTSHSGTPAFKPVEPGPHRSAPAPKGRSAGGS